MKTKIINFLPILFLVIFGLFCAKGLFKYYAFSTHDGDYHIARSFDAVQTLKERHFPLRWAGSLNSKCGVPIFNFFYPLIYYMVFLIYLFSHDVINSLKIVASLSFIAGPIFFYLWLNRETNNKIASFVGAFLYLFVPYRFLLVYVRFSPEFVAYTFLPIVLWLLTFFIAELKNKKCLTFRIWFIAFVLSFTGGVFIFSHNFAVMLLFPIITLYVILKMWSLKILKKNILMMAFVLISFIGISAFFLGPMFLEMKNTKLNTMITFNYEDHFPALWQLIKSKWDYGPSSLGTDNDRMSFMLGYVQWLVIGFTSLFLAHSFLKKKKEKIPFNIIFWFSISIVSIFLILPWSKFIWDKIRPLQTIQFSWRFLGITSFTIAALTGFLLSEIKSKKLFYLLVFIFLSVAFCGNRNHLLPQPVLYPENYQNFDKNNPNRFTTTTVNDDILDRESKSACLLSDSFVIFSSGEEILDWKVERGNSFGKIKLVSPVDKKVSIKLNLEYFPGIYEMKVNGKSFVNERNCQGKICLDAIQLRKGENSVEWKIVQNAVEKLFNCVTIVFGSIWLSVLFYVYFKKSKN